MNAVIPPMPPSLWAATAPPPPSTTPLVGEARTGVAVVGGGFTGLSVALHLAEAGVPVTLLEAAEIGWGASGRNNGQVIPTLSRIDPDDIVAAVAQAQGGREKGEQLVGLIRDSAAFTFDLIRRHGIEAEAVQNGWIALLPEVRANLHLDPASDKAQELGRRWEELLARTMAGFKTIPQLGKAIEDNYKTGKFEGFVGAPQAAELAFMEQVKAARDAAKK